MPSTYPWNPPPDGGEAQRELLRRWLDLTQRVIVEPERGRFTATLKLHEGEWTIFADPDSHALLKRLAQEATS